MDINIYTVFDRYHRITVIIFFAAYLFIGLVISEDYGVSWDEKNNISLGQRSLEYINSSFMHWFGHAETKPEDDFFKGVVAEQGPFFEILLKGLEKVFKIEDIRSVLLMRHKVTFFMFWCGALAFYFLLNERFADRKPAIIGVLFLILTPRIFANSFYNSKDTVLLAFFIISTYTMFRFLKSSTFINLFFHAFFCSATIDVRIVGLLLPAVTLFMLVIKFFRERNGKREGRKLLAYASVYLALLIALVILFWPKLWGSPLKNFLTVLHKLSQANQFDNNFSFFGGSFIKVDELPLYYLPFWMVITIPASFTFFFLTGLGFSLMDFFRKPIFDKGNMHNLIFLLLFFSPLAAVFVTRPLLYDGWRHFYFIFPAFIAIAIFGITELASYESIRKYVLIFLAMSIIHAGYYVVRYHPYQNVYFNIFAGKDIEKKYELDYWGLSFREGLEFVLKNEQTKTIPISVSDLPGILNSYILPEKQRERLKFVPLHQAAYFISNHRHPKHFESFLKGTYPYVNEVYSVEAGGAKLLGVYKLR